MDDKEPKLTFRQDRAVNAYIRDEGRSQARALIEAGYSYAVSRQPHKVFGSPAVIRALEKRGANFFRKVQYDKLESTIRAVEVPNVDFSQNTREQLQDLKEKLNALSGEPVRWRSPRETKESDENYILPAVYTPLGGGVGIFNVEAKL